MGPEQHMFRTFADKVLKKIDDNGSSGSPDLSQVKITERPPRASYARQAMSRQLLSMTPDKLSSYLVPIILRSKTWQ